MYLEDLSQIDVIGPAQAFMEQQGFVLHPDGRIRSIVSRYFKINTSWLNAKVAADRNCFLWHIVYFQQYRLISRNCFNCWKVVTSPQTLEALLKVRELQLKMGIPAKCGIERRPFAQHKTIYTAFWYAPMKDGLEGAKVLHKRISLKIKDLLGVQQNVILKRGCTEMENDAGPTNEWIYPVQQHKFEDLLDATWEVPIFLHLEPAALVTYTLIQWIIHAIRHRDPTAKNYYKSLRSLGITDTVFYHDVEPKISSIPEFKLMKEADNGPSIQRLPEN